MMIPEPRTQLIRTPGEPNMFLRVQATDTGLSQMLYQPATTTNPGYGFIANFSNAVLADVNAAQLSAGFISLRIAPAILEQFHLAMLARLLQPFTGYFELDVDGTYSVAGTVTTVLVDSIAACDIQPA
jgi:hypothetical protein